MGFLSFSVREMRGFFYSSFCWIQIPILWKFRSWEPGNWWQFSGKWNLDKFDLVYEVSGSNSVFCLKDSSFLLDPCCLGFGFPEFVQDFFLVCEVCVCGELNVSFRWICRNPAKMEVVSRNVRVDSWDLIGFCENLRLCLSLHWIWLEFQLRVILESFFLLVLEIKFQMWIWIWRSNREA